MPQETLGYTELEWTCKRCGSKNLGTARNCVSCGAPMSESANFELPPEQQMMTDLAAIAKAKIGPDIHCRSCGTRNPGNAKVCSQCGADLTGSTQRQSGQVLGAFSSVPAPDVKCPSCGQMNPALALKCKNCGSTLTRSTAPAFAPRPITTPKSKSNPLIWIGVAAIALFACWFLFLRTTDVSASVQSVEWQRTIDILAQRPVDHSTWRDQIPSGASIGSCTQKVRSTQDNPAPNSTKICGTPYTIDQGNGTGKVVQDCKYEVKDAWCAYTQLEWVTISTANEQGTDFNPIWPRVNLASDQREGDRHESYQVIFSSESKQYTYTTLDAIEFQRYTPGSRWSIKVNALGGVTSVSPAK
jgi:membrane protease subunit (stomatin/prohibitin family)